MWPLTEINKILEDRKQNRTKKSSRIDIFK